MVRPNPAMTSSWTSTSFFAGSLHIRSCLTHEHQPMNTVSVTTTFVLSPAAPFRVLEKPASLDHSRPWPHTRCEKWPRELFLSLDIQTHSLPVTLGFRKINERGQQVSSSGVQITSSHQVPALSLAAGVYLLWRGAGRPGLPRRKRP